MLWSDPFTPLISQLTRPPAFLPPADVTVSEADIVVTLDLPGLAADDVSIELVDGNLVVRGERKRPEIAPNTSWAHSERAFGSFERRFRVPDGVDPDRIMASMDNGALSLIVPKPQRLKPRRIGIGSPAEPRRLETAAA